MTYTNANWTCVSSSLNQGQELVDVYGVGVLTLNAPNLFIYGSPNDTIATIEAANYFLQQGASLSAGDIIIATGTDASNLLIVTFSDSTSVITESFTVSGTVSTANIVNNAVTYAKIQQASANTLIGNATSGTANVEEITLGNGLAFSGTTLSIPNTNIRYATVNLTLAQFLGMYATPVQILAAPGAGLMHIVDKIMINMAYGSAQLAAGGAVGAQYGLAIHGTGPSASATEAATDFTSATASTMFRMGGGLSTGAVTSTAINTAVCLSNATAAFTTGTGATFVVDVWYVTVPAV